MGELLLLNLPIIKFQGNSMFLKFLHADGQKDMAELIHIFLNFQLQVCYK